MVAPPNQDVDRATDAVVENGDAHWDSNRFGSYLYVLYNVLLLQEQERGGYERIGVGKMHWQALHHAGATREHIRLV